MKRLEHTHIVFGLAVSLALLLPAPAASAVSLRDAGSSGLPARVLGPVTPAALDDNIPGVAVPASPFSGTLNGGAGDYVDVFQVNLTEGEAFTAEGITTTSGEWDYMFFELRDPTDTDVWDGSGLTYSGYSYDGLKSRLQWVAQETATYYLVVWGEGGYQVNYQTYSLAGDDDIVGASTITTPAPGGQATTNGSVNWRTDFSDLYQIWLNEGEQVTFNLNGAYNTDFGMLLYQPGTMTAWGNEIYTYAEWTALDGVSAYPKAITHRVPPGGSGWHYLEVTADVGGSALAIESGTYVLTTSVDFSNTQRIAGMNRYKTSLALSKSTYGDSFAAIIATGRGYADALSASGLAGAIGGPVLLIDPNDLYGQSWYDAYDELYRLGVWDVYLVGGTGVVPEEFQWGLEEIGFLGTTHRLGGGTRYETARLVAEEILDLFGPPEWAFVVRGTDFADALSVAPYAYNRGYPVLLTRPDALDPTTAGFIEDNDVLNVLVAGGGAAVSDTALSALENLNGGTTQATRVAGLDRYDTAAQIAEFAIGTQGWGSWHTIGIATGQNFPDALSGGAACGARSGGALLLTRRDSLPTYTRDTILAHNSGDISEAMILGGAAAVSEPVKTEVVDRLNE